MCWLSAAVAVADGPAVAEAAHESVLPCPVDPGLAVVPLAEVPAPPSLVPAVQVGRTVRRSSLVADTVRVGHGYCCGYYGYPYGSLQPVVLGWGGAAAGASPSVSAGVSVQRYTVATPTRTAIRILIPTPRTTGRYAPAPAPAPAAGYLDATEEHRTQPPDQIQQPAASFGMISMKVQPVDAEVLVDGETWTSPSTSRLVIQLAPGRHHVTVRKTGFDTYTEDILIRVGATMTLNVSLLRGEK